MNRVFADEAKAELEELGLMQNLARDFFNPTVDAILRRMVAKAVELPNAQSVTPSTARAFLPELFERQQNCPA